MGDEELVKENNVRPFKSADNVAPELVESVSSSSSSSSSSSPAPALEPDPDPEKKDTAVTVAVDDKPTRTEVSAKAPKNRSQHDAFSDVLSRQLTSREKSAELAKQSKAPQRPLLILLGFFVAAIAGIYSNGFVTATIETLSEPLYVRHFHDAEYLNNHLINEQERGIKEMRAALADGEKVEPDSRRFTELSATFAGYLDDAKRYVEAKRAWSKAATSVGMAAPDLREQRRAFLINEAISEHFAFASQEENGVDLHLLDQLEAAAKVFETSEVGNHRGRAYHAYIAASSLAADANDFSRSAKDLQLANDIFDSQTAELFDESNSFLEAKWLSSLQETVQTLANYDGQTVLRSSYKPAGRRTSYDALHSAFEENDFNKAEAVLEKAQDAHLEDICGSTILTDLYSTAHVFDGPERSPNYLDRLSEWLKRFPNSPRAHIAHSFALTAKASRKIDSMTVSQLSNEDLKDLYGMISESMKDLQIAIKLNPHLAYEPSILEAIQSNLHAAEGLSNKPIPNTRILAELRKISVEMIGDDSQLELVELGLAVPRLTTLQESLEPLVKRAAIRADKMDADAGDVFYARAIYKIGKESWFDNGRYERGNTILKKKFGAIDDGVQ